MRKQQRARLIVQLIPRFSEDERIKHGLAFSISLLRYILESVSRQAKLDRFCCRSTYRKGINPDGQGPVSRRPVSSVLISLDFSEALVEVSTALEIMSSR